MLCVIFADKVEVAVGWLLFSNRFLSTIRPRHSEIVVLNT
jgi:hypothetical protein